MNKGKAVFELSTSSGFIQQRNGNTVISGDLDNDGDVDLFTTAYDESSYIYENHQNDQRFLKLQLIGFKSNRDAIGSKIYFWEGGKLGETEYLLGLRTVEAGSGLASTNSKIVHFGTGNQEIVDISVEFPSGIIINKKDVKPGSFLTIEELEGNEKFMSLVSWCLASIYHSFDFWIEFIVFSLVALLMFYGLPFLFRIKIKPIIHYLILPIVIILVFRLILNSDSLLQRLIISNLFGVITSILVFQKYKQKLKTNEIDELTDHLWNELVLFQHGEWARSNINQLLMFAQNIDESNQSGNTFRSQLLKAINVFIQTTYPAIRRIISFSKNIDENKKEGEKLEKISAKIYNRLELSKNLIQLNEHLIINEMRELSHEIKIFKQDIDHLKNKVEQKYQSDLCKLIVPITDRYSHHKKIKIYCQPDSLKGVTVRIKSIELTAIIDNLILNAIKASKHKDQPQLKIFGENKDERFLIHFCDNGIGISEGKLEKIFEAGFSTSNSPGNGKGLAFSKKILKKYNGYIYVNSTEPGKGTDMVIELAKCNNYRQDFNHNI